MVLGSCFSVAKLIINYNISSNFIYNFFFYEQFAIILWTLPTLCFIAIFSILYSAETTLLPEVCYLKYYQSVIVEFDAFVRQRQFLYSPKDIQNRKDSHLYLSLCYMLVVIATQLPESSKLEYFSSDIFCCKPLNSNFHAQIIFTFYGYALLATNKRFIKVIKFNSF